MSYHLNSASWRAQTPRNAVLALMCGVSMALSGSAEVVAAEEPLLITGSVSSINVMKATLPVFPTFAALTPRKEHLRGFAKDANGKPLVGAVIGVRVATRGEDEDSLPAPVSATTDANGYYELFVPWGAAHFSCASYIANYDGKTIALSLHPADGESWSFASSDGLVKNWVLLPYGIADSKGAHEKPAWATNYYGGSFAVWFKVGDPRPTIADKASLPDETDIELTLVPQGKLIDGSEGRTIIVHKHVKAGEPELFTVNNVPLGTYTLNANLLEKGNTSPLLMMETGRDNTAFGLEPQNAQGQAKLTFRPQNHEAQTTLPQHGNWGDISIRLQP